jgi:uncharacterized membrane protein
MSLVTRPFAQLSELDEIARNDKHNLSQVERTASMAAGGLLVAAALASRSRPGILLGLLGCAALLRGATGHCEVYQRLGINTARPHPERGVPGNKGINMEATEHVARPVDELFRYWRRLENLPTFMPHVIAVEETAEGISHWKVKGPLNTELEWDAEIIEEQPGRMLSWQTLPGAAVASAGSVWFEPEGDGTRVKVSLQYQPPAGLAGAAVAKVLGVSPAKRVQENLASFKELMEREA